MIYEYKCTNCSYMWEEDDKKISDPVTTICPKCLNETAKRLISGGTGFILSGGCWAKDGYKSSK